MAEILPKDGIVLSPKQFGPLGDEGAYDYYLNGSTLLGADNKAGVAEIMTVELLMKSDRPHTEMKILFTPDEEIGRGADHVDLEKLGADFDTQWTVPQRARWKTKHSPLVAQLLSSVVQVSGLCTRKWAMP